MPAATRTRHRWHAPEKGSGPAFALSILAHALLFIAIAFMVRWKSEPVATVSAELWSLPPAVVQQPTPPPPPRPVVVEPPPPEPEPRKADIVMEQKKALPPPKVEQKKVVPPDPPKKQETKAADLKRAAEEKKAAQQLEAAQQAAAKRALDRALAQAGPAASMAASGLSNAYQAQIRGCIRPHIIFNVPDAIRPQQYVAEFEVMLLPTGEQATDPKLLKASGLAAYDQAVERAIRRCNPFPPPKEGTMPRSLRLSFDPVETR
jgi:colicin import membrane protein